MIKFFHLQDPGLDIFAYASRRGTWYPERSKVCPECHSSRQKRVSPLILEWEPGSDQIGDFVWPGFNDEMVVTQRVREGLESRYKEIEFKDVEFFQSHSLKQPTRITKRSTPRVWLPYTGPTLWDVNLTKWVHLDLTKSTVTIGKTCLICGRTRYSFVVGEERFLVVDKNSWNGEKFFHLYEQQSLLFCTEEVKEFIEQAGYTNVGFREDGIIPI